ncbi:glycerophosphodiester phosphodiesterase [Alteromonas sediminis]|uniref:Glycerophosphodiester phosphodiesterase n=1 Tax=Alteromonas sediminis TaxID=2259342 RepID=A0A3N5Y026_9ALTE|nr:glycerophosphodiester phosphodiesterase family protein [Alteromonas sediminis]RPJ66340.1 glycerophosphodiester phosphodiesterase [Alteromonas sediminis]
MLIIGHRGASGYAPENTVEAFKLALIQKAHGIECDVFQIEGTSSVIIHDFHLDRTTNGKGFVPDCTLTDIRRLNAGNGNKVPVLSELFECLNETTWCNLELKYIEDIHAWVDEIKRLLAAYPYIVNKLVISSFNHPWLREIANQMPTVKIAYLIAHYPLHIVKTIKEFDAFAVNVDINIINQKLVDVIHSNNQQVWVFTVNKLEDMKRCRAMGVDGIFTNYPDIALDCI